MERKNVSSIDIFLAILIKSGYIRMKRVTHVPHFKPRLV